MERQISQGFVEQLHRDNAAEVQPQATEVSQPGAQGPPALHERGNAGGHAGEERHLPGLSGAGGDLTISERANKRGFFLFFFCKC